MSNAEFDSEYGLPENRERLDANLITSAFVRMREAIENITDKNIERGSIFNRHIVNRDVPGESFPLKHISTYTTPPAFGGAGTTMNTPTAAQVIIQPDPAAYPPSPGLPVQALPDAYMYHTVFAFGTIPFKIFNSWLQEDVTGAAFSPNSNTGICEFTVDLVHEDTAGVITVFSRQHVRLGPEPNWILSRGLTAAAEIQSLGDENRVVQICGSFTPPTSASSSNPLGVYMRINGGAYNHASQPVSVIDPSPRTTLTILGVCR